MRNKREITCTHCNSMKATRRCLQCRRWLCARCHCSRCAPGMQTAGPAQADACFESDMLRLTALRMQRRISHDTFKFEAAVLARMWGVRRSSREVITAAMAIKGSRDIEDSEAPFRWLWRVGIARDMYRESKAK